MEKITNLVDFIEIFVHYVLENDLINNYVVYHKVLYSFINIENDVDSFY